MKSNIAQNWKIKNPINLSVLARLPQICMSPQLNYLKLNISNSFGIGKKNKYTNISSKLLHKHSISLNSKDRLSLFTKIPNKIPYTDNILPKLRNKKVSITIPSIIAKNKSSSVMEYNDVLN